MQIALVMSAVILGGSIVGAAFVLTQPPQKRFDFTVQNRPYGGDQTITLIYRLDRLTGEVDVCFLDRLATMGTVLSAPQPTWCAKDFTDKNK